MSGRGRGRAYPLPSGLRGGGLRFLFLLTSLFRGFDHPLPQFQWTDRLWGRAPGTRPFGPYWSADAIGPTGEFLSDVDLDRCRRGGEVRPPGR
jgi:hypothetical protein